MCCSFLFNIQSQINALLLVLLWSGICFFLFNRKCDIRNLLKEYTHLLAWEKQWFICCSSLLSFVIITPEYCNCLTFSKLCSSSFALILEWALVNSSRSWLWEHHLQRQVCIVFRLVSFLYQPICLWFSPVSLLVEPLVSASLNSIGESPSPCLISVFTSKLWMFSVYFHFIHGSLIV